MGKIKKILENELVGGTQTTDVYPVTSTKAVYDENNERLDNIINKLDNTINKIEPGIIYDVSANNDGAVFESLQALLSSSNLGTLIPISVQHGGMSIRFIQGSVPNSDNKYVQYRLAASIWSTDIHDWTSEDPYFVDKIMQEVNEAINENTPIEIHGDVANAPDEEDLTSVNQGGTDVLKFKDKEYNPLTYSGMGRKILRKNMVNGVNTLTQEMINQANTIYVIQYDFTLGENITVPENCVLEFNGGSLSGAYTLTGTNTCIVSELVKIFNSDVIFAGTWNVAEVYPEWFGAVGDETITDDTVAIQKAINFAEARGNGKGKVKLSKGHRINSTITIRNCSFDGGGNNLQYYGNGTAISLLGNHFMTTIENFVLANSGGEGLNGIKNENEGADTSSGLNNSWIRHITVYSFKKYGFHFRNAWLCNLEGLRAEYCKNTNNDAVGLYVDRAYNSKFYNINAEDNNIGINLYCLSTSFRGVCVDRCTHIGIAASYVVGCSIEDVHFECRNENASGIKIFDGKSNTFKNIFMSTNKTGFKAFDFSELGADVYSYGHIFQDLHFNLQSDSITFALHTTSISYPRVYDCTVLNSIVYEAHGILYTGNGYIRFLNTSNTTGHNKDILVEVNNGSPRIIPNSSEQISNNFAIISDCASIHGDGITKGIYDLSRSFIGFIFVYTNKAFAIYSNIAYDANVPNLIFTSDSNVFNTTNGIRWQLQYSTTYTLVIPDTFGASDIINVELKELKFT